jgi:putative ABC transport system ATP-binding protein
MSKEEIRHPVIETRNVTKCYGLEEELTCSITVLDSVNLKIKKGSFVAIMGPSGSGKTTLLDVVGALLKPTSGEVYIDGELLNELDDNELAELRREKLGFVFQQYNLVSTLTATENVEFPLRIAGVGREAATRHAQRLLRSMGLGHRLNNKPTQLSGGEQQRVAISRALANDPEIILADEPTGNLDSKTGKMVLELLKELNKKKNYTIIVVTHDHRISSYVDKVINIKDGRIISGGK